MKILFITSNRLGDAILSTGVLAHYLELYPDAEVTVLCGRIPAPLFRAAPGVHHVMVVEKQRFASHWLAPFFSLLRQRWDLLIDLRDVTIMHILPAKARVKSRNTGPNRHKLEEFAEAVGAPGSVIAPTIWLDDTATKKASALIPEGGHIIAMGPVAGQKRKLWRPERYAEVAHALTGSGGAMEGATIAVFGAPAERSDANQLIELLPKDRVIDLVGKTDPLEAAAALARCSVYVGVDSGLMHLAAAMDVPTLGLFGELGVPQVYRPWGTHTAFVHRRNENWTADDKPSAMDAISVEEVIRAAEELIKRAGVPPKI